MKVDINNPVAIKPTADVEVGDYVAVFIANRWDKKSPTYKSYLVTRTTKARFYVACGINGSLEKAFHKKDGSEVGGVHVFTKNKIVSKATHDEITDSNAEYRRFAIARVRLSDIVGDKRTQSGAIDAMLAAYDEFMKTAEETK